MAQDKDRREDVPAPEEGRDVSPASIREDQAGDQEDANSSRPPEGWFDPPSASRLHAPDAPSIPHAFLTMERAAPGEVAVADRTKCRTRRDILVGALALARRFRKYPGDRLGFLMPSVPAVAVAWLAAQLAGKIPVFLNWTVGMANLRHCLHVARISHVLGVAELLRRMEGLPRNVTLVGIEDLSEEISGLERLYAALLAKLPPERLLARVPRTAAILFTSGSEALPKAVPLTHENLITNARDIIVALRLKADETVLAMLPPFHAFGLMVDIVLPLAAGLRGAYHPNPTDFRILVRLVRDFKLTLLAAPPTFLDSMLDRAKGTQDMASLRYSFIGAERCPEHLHALYAGTCPDSSLCEGYGVTECSPVIAVNRPGHAVQGTVGLPMDSLETAVVEEEDEVPLGRVGTGKTGMLLVRGPSVFEGYLADREDPFVEFEGKRWYRTGDLASRDADGRLTIRGRIKRFVKIGGETVSLPQVEGVLLSAFAEGEDAHGEGPLLAVDAMSTPRGPQLVCFTTMDVEPSTLNAELRNAGLSPLHTIRRVVRLESIPLLGSGKTDYRSLKRMLAQMVQESGN
ncbi:MAG: AMP-binding protein [Desulfovibrio sp.]|jgi:acyl-CoA synthetase (AMP-forming)/AMP-acid ligase II|nr:AMP-binding protein [Desulfovibrio sp.]